MKWWSLFSGLALGWGPGLTPWLWLKIPWKNGVQLGQLDHHHYKCQCICESDVIGWSGDTLFFRLMLAFCILRRKNVAERGNLLRSRPRPRLLLLPAEMWRRRLCPFWNLKRDANWQPWCVPGSTCFLCFSGAWLSAAWINCWVFF